MSSKDTKKTWGSGGLGGATFRVGASMLLMSLTPFFCLWIWYLSKNAMSVGPITIVSGKTVTIPSGQRWLVL